MQIAGIEPTAREKLRQIIQRYLDGDVYAACPADVASRMRTSCTAGMTYRTGTVPLVRSVRGAQNGIFCRAG
jgi:hypothetical protein